MDSVLQEPDETDLYAKNFDGLSAKKFDVDAGEIHMQQPYAKNFDHFSAEKFDENVGEIHVPLQQPLIEQILDVTNPEKFGHGPYNEEEILERARQVLEMANKLYPDLQSSPDQDHDVTSRIMDKTGISLLHELEPIVSSTPHRSGTKSVISPSEYMSPRKIPADNEPSASELFHPILFSL